MYDKVKVKIFYVVIEYIMSKNFFVNPFEKKENNIYQFI